MSKLTSVSSESVQEPSQLRRRGVIAGAAAFAAALVAKEALAPERAAAADGSNLVLGTVGSNTATSLTTLSVTNAVAAAFRVVNNAAPTPDSEPDGVQAFANNQPGQIAASALLGRNDDLNGVGAYGIATNGTGIAGQSTGGTAVSGSSTSGAGGYFTTTTNGVGVFGQTASGVAVFGLATSGNGVQGFSTSGYGVQGQSTNGIGLYGASFAQFGAAFYAVNYYPGGAGYAGYFLGVTLVNGMQVVTGSKSAAVPHPDGSHRLLYCVESPESWFEDFGEGTITAGKAEVALDPEFALTVDTSKLHVFVTPHDASHHLAVTAKTGAKFSIAAGVSGDAAARGVKTSDVNGTFTYRVVAKRKDVEAPRLAKFDVPKPLPPPPAPPTVPKGPGRRADGPVIKH